MNKNRLDAISGRDLLGLMCAMRGHGRTVDRGPAVFVTNSLSFAVFRIDHLIERTCTTCDALFLRPAHDTGMN